MLKVKLEAGHKWGSSVLCPLDALSLQTIWVMRLDSPTLTLCITKLGGGVDTLERIVTVQNVKLTAIIWGLTKINVKSCTWNRIIPSS